MVYDNFVNPLPSSVFWQWSWVLHNCYYHEVVDAEVVDAFDKVRFCWWLEWWMEGQVKCCKRCSYSFFNASYWALYKMLSEWQVIQPNPTGLTFPLVNQWRGDKLWVHLCVSRVRVLLTPGCRQCHTDSIIEVYIRALRWAPLKQKECFGMRLWLRQSTKLYNESITLAGPREKESMMECNRMSTHMWPFCIATHIHLAALDAWGCQLHNVQDCCTWSQSLKQLQQTLPFLGYENIWRP